MGPDRASRAGAMFWTGNSRSTSTDLLSAQNFTEQMLSVKHPLSTTVWLHERSSMLLLHKVGSLRRCLGCPLIALTSRMAMSGMKERHGL